jgi:predicted aspartyl protease
MFGPQEEDNYILNKATGQKMMLKARGRGSYVMEVQFVGGEKTTSMVDSGAEESVCPWEWGERLFGTQHSKEHMQFKNASGGNIEHWGMREVKVTSTKIYKLFASISILVWDSIV